MSPNQFFLISHRKFYESPLPFWKCFGRTADRPFKTLSESTKIFPRIINSDDFERQQKGVRLVRESTGPRETLNSPSNNLPNGAGRHLQMRPSSGTRHIASGFCLKISSSLKQAGGRAPVNPKNTPFFRRGWNCPLESAESCRQRKFCVMATQKDGSSPSLGPLSIDICGIPVPLTGGPGVPESHVKQAIESNVFKQWINYMTGHNGILNLGGNGGTRCSLKKVTIQNVDFFGPRVGFVKFKAEVIDEETGAKLPGIVFGRGGAVGILMLLECEGEKYAVLTEQARVPVGRTLVELPAGMLDSDIGDFVGTAAREIEEEIGIRVQSSDLVDLTALLDESTGRKMFPSPGGSDEDITLFLYRNYVDKEVIKSLQGAETGLRDHGELIKVKVVPYSSLWRSTADSKALAAIAIYEMASREGILPPAPNTPELSNL